MRSKDFVSVFLLQQLLVTASRSGKEKEMNRKDVKKLLLAVIAVVIVAKIARDIMKARKQLVQIRKEVHRAGGNNTENHCSCNQDFQADRKRFAEGDEDVSGTPEA